MITYQDLLAIGNDDMDRADFARLVISEHKRSDLYLTAAIADEYDRCRNTTTMEYQKLITDTTGRQYVDDLATVHRSTSNFFNIFTTQLNQYLLGNGVSWANNAAPKKLGKDFDQRLQQAGHYALCGGVSYGFYNLDHVEVFPVTQFAPLEDEENGSLSAGVRFWQIDEGKPMRGVLYELDGYTPLLWATEQQAEHIDSEWRKIGKDTYMKTKRAYKIIVQRTEAEGEKIYNGENYPAFPIVPLWGNPHHQSELVGMREKIDAYDFILNGWEDDLDNAQLYWIIKGAGGMDDPDLERFLDRLRTIKAAAPADGQDIVPVTVNIPVQARESLLQRLERQLYRDAMVMNPEDIAGGAVTATQINAGYERQNIKADQYEYCILDFINGLLTIAGVEDQATFTRSRIVNKSEEIQNVVQGAQYLTEDYVTKKILEIMGDGDQAEEITQQRAAEAMARLGAMANLEGGEAE